VNSRKDLLHDDSNNTINTVLSIIIIIIIIIIHAADSRGRKAFIRFCVTVYVNMCVCPRDRTKTAETTYHQIWNLSQR